MPRPLTERQSLERERQGLLVRLVGFHAAPERHSWLYLPLVCQVCHWTATCQMDTIMDSAGLASALLPATCWARWR